MGIEEATPGFCLVIYRRSPLRMYLILCVCAGGGGVRVDAGFRPISGQSDQYIYRVPTLSLPQQYHPSVPAVWTPTLYLPGKIECIADQSCAISCREYLSEGEKRGDR